MTSSFQFEALFDIVMHQSCELLEADRASLFLVDYNTDQMYSKVANDSDEIRVPRSASICGYVSTTGEPLLINNAYEDARFNPSSDIKIRVQKQNLFYVLP